MLVRSSSIRAVRRRRSRRSTAPALALALVATLAACGPPVTQTMPARPAPATEPAASTAPGTPSNAIWPLKTREHVDLWLHGYALLMNDTAKVPLFRRGYADSIARRKAATSTVTVLDANRDQLRSQLAERPSLEQGQFVPLYFADWAELRRAGTVFLETNGNPSRASSPQLARMVAFLAGVYPTPADRDWLRLFLLGLDDEQVKFFQAYWSEQQEARAPVLAAVQTEWQARARPKLQGFLNNTRQNTGDIMLSLALGGEGRTVAGGSTESVVAVTFPATAAEADQAIHVFVHEVVGQVAQQAVEDNTTPAEKRDGVAAGLQSMAAVRGGALLLQRAAPELAEGYMEYYLNVAGVAAGTGDQAIRTTFERTFPLPTSIRDALARQLDSILAGI
ncbi:MAG: hypothetical protein ACYC2G_03060 [Gemmatimonadaceae bacterium]